MMSDRIFQFEISLTVLNSLGRHLYKNFSTILSEAISNAWDADASNLRIYTKKDSFIIIDDGIGMDDDDFQHKFLKVGYTKRVDDKNWETAKKRPFIGRKGIGKLALLSCAGQIHILTTKNGTTMTGGIIDNSKLDKAIAIDSAPYNLDIKNDSIFESYKRYIPNHGTIIIFTNINKDIKQYITPSKLRTIIALNFKFSLIDKEFKIFIDDKEVSIDDIKSLIQGTEFVWEIGKLNEAQDIFFDSLMNKKNAEEHPLKKHEKAPPAEGIKGFIASVEKPSDLTIPQLDEKVGVDIYVHGRLRAKDVIRNKMGALSTRIPNSYLYGQIHCDDLDKDGMEDIFPSSREGIGESVKYKEVLDKLELIMKTIIEDWDKFRRENKEDGDSENKNLSRPERKSQELFNAIINDDYTKKQIKDHKIIFDKLNLESKDNFVAYADCYVAENLLRYYISKENIKLSEIAIKKAKELTNKEEKLKRDAELSISIRSKTDDIYYLDMCDLAKIIDPDEKGKYGSHAISYARQYKPLRHAVMHTALLTDVAKTQLKAVGNNIKGRVTTLLNDKIKSKPDRKKSTPRKKP